VVTTRNHRLLTWRRSALTVTALAALVTTSACGSDDASVESALDVASSDAGAVLDTAVSQAESSTDELADTLRANGLDSIAGVVEQVDVSEWLDEGDFTFFAPNNEAFLGLDADQTADLLADPSQIVEVLRNHTVASTVLADELVTMDSAETEAGETLVISVDDGTVRLGDVAVVTTDIEAGGGVIHVVDGLLIP